MKLTIKKTIITLFLITFAYELAFSAGTATAQFLKMGADAKAASLGGAYCAMANDSTAIYWNPAGISAMSYGHFAFSHAIWFGDMSYDWFSFAHSFDGMGSFGFAAQYFSYGQIIGMDEFGNKTSNFSPSDTALTISYAKEMESICVEEELFEFAKISLGANLKYITSSIKHTAEAFAADFGAKMEYENISAGLVLQNAGTSMKFLSEESPLPLNIKTGIAYKIDEEWLLVSDVNIPFDSDPNLAAGTQYNYFFDDLLSIACRAGLNTTTKDVPGISGISIGFGITYDSFTFDYAFLPMGDLGDTHRLSISSNFMF